jgi:hypothetical protein
LYVSFRYSSNVVRRISASSEASTACRFASSSRRFRLFLSPSALFPSELSSEIREGNRVLFHVSDEIDYACPLRRWSAEGT